MTATSFPSCLYISGNGNLIEMVDFAGEQVEYVINGISEHIIFGIYFSFNQRFEL